jgi:anti-sigma-K factor RskA
VDDRRHQEYRELIPSYVLNAASPEEMQEIGRHIVSCEQCMEEAESYSAAASALTLLVDPVPVPEGFPERVGAAARGDARTETAPATARRRPRERWGRLVPVLVLALVAAATVVLVVDARREAARHARVEELLALERGMAMRGLGDARARVVPHRDGFTFVASGLDAPPEGRTYQLWVIDGDHPESAGVFGVEDGEALVTDDASLRGVDAAAVTLEPEGGSDSPTGSPVISSA